MLQKSFVKANKAVFAAQARRAFSQNTTIASFNPDLNHNLRVMSTPTWPVPYYQRIFRHPANLDKDGNDNLLCIEEPCDESHVMAAKELLKIQGDGYVVEAIEQHYDIKSYVTDFENSEQFSNAYVDDLLDCLGLANEQNRRILGEHDFSDCLN